MADYLRRLTRRLAEGWRGPVRARRLLHAAVAHALEFETWRSLAAQGLSDAEAAGLMAGLAGGIAGLKARAR